MTLVVAILAVTGCDRYTGPFGSYVLEQIDGQALPFVVRADSIQTLTLLADELIISPLGVFRRRTLHSALDPTSGATGEISSESNGTVTPGASSAHWQLRQDGCYGDVLALCLPPPTFREASRGKELQLLTEEAPARSFRFVRR